MMIFAGRYGNGLIEPCRFPFFDLAAKTGLFDRLTKPLSATELAEEMDFDRASIEPFLEVLLSMGLLAKKGDRYVNQERTTRYLTSGSPISSLPGYQNMVAMTGGILDNLEIIPQAGGQEISGAAGRRGRL